MEIKMIDIGKLKTNIIYNEDFPEKNEIKIRYNHSPYAEANRHLDNSIEGAMKKLGYKFYLSGYDYTTKERTMIFREEK